jgi:hypothetical protein
VLLTKIKENKMDNYIPKIGDLFTVGSTPRVYQRCSSVDINKHFGTSIPNRSVCFMYETVGGSLCWDCFEECADFKPAVPKPPIGIIPLANHNALRLNVLMDVLQRYAQDNTPAKPQWVQEVKDLIEYERSLTREALDKVPFKL